MICLRPPTVVTMGCGDACPAVPAKKRLDWALPDPKTLPDPEFRAVRDEIERRAADAFKHHVDGNGKVFNRIEHGAVEIDGNGFDAQGKCDFRHDDQSVVTGMPARAPAGAG